MGNHGKDRQQHLFTTTEGADRGDVMAAAVRQRLTMAMAEIDQIRANRRLPQPLRCRGGLNIAHKNSFKKQNPATNSAVTAGHSTRQEGQCRAV